MGMSSLEWLHTERVLSKTAVWIVCVLEEVAGNARIHGEHELERVAEVVGQVAAEEVA